MRRLRKGRAAGCLLTLLIILLLLALLLHARSWVGQWFFPREYEDIVSESCAPYGIDPYLIMAMIREESGFKPDAVSSAGAYGLMQLMPDTADWIIAKAGFEFSLEQALTDPACNIAAGVWYIHWLDATYYDGAHLPAAIAAYNAGHSTVDKWLADGVWDGTLENIGGIPYAETRQYLQYVYRSYQMYIKLYA